MRRLREALSLHIVVPLSPVIAPFLGLVGTRLGTPEGQVLGASRRLARLELVAVLIPRTTRPLAKKGATVGQCLCSFDLTAVIVRAIPSLETEESLRPEETAVPERPDALVTALLAVSSPASVTVTEVIGTDPTSVPLSGEASHAEDVMDVAVPPLRDTVVGRELLLCPDEGRETVVEEDVVIPVEVTRKGARLPATAHVIPESLRPRRDSQKRAQSG